MVEELNECLKAQPEKPWDGLKIVTTGILADSTDLLQILEDNHIAVADDQVTHESIYFREDTPVMDDPVEAMAVRIGNVEGCSILYDPGKRRAHMLVELAQAAKADGVLFILTKFCDPEEYDYVPVKEALAKAGIPLLQIEVDQQMTNYEQARSAIETFAEMLS
jgi:benzoyl-CoA reductase/2-hydroxyglutaryl-CoA dehydratase subunit BcrC/BadD/HgdB